MPKLNKRIKQSTSTRDGEIPCRLVINSALCMQCPVSAGNEADSVEQKAVFCCTNEFLRRLGLVFFSSKLC